MENLPARKWRRGRSPVTRSSSSGRARNRQVWMIDWDQRGGSLGNSQQQLGESKGIRRCPGIDIGSRLQSPLLIVGTTILKRRGSVASLDFHPLIVVRRVVV